MLYNQPINHAVQKQKQKRHTWKRTNPCKLYVVCAQWCWWKKRKCHNRTKGNVCMWLSQWWTLVVRSAHTNHSPLASFNSAPGTPGGGGAASALFDKQGSRLLSVRRSTIRGPVSAKGQGIPDAEQSSPSWAAKRDCADVCAVQERRQPCVWLCERKQKISVTCGLIKQGKPGKRERFMAYARIEQSEGVPAFGET